MSEASSEVEEILYSSNREWIKSRVIVSYYLLSKNAQTSIFLKNVALRLDSRYQCAEYNNKENAKKYYNKELNNTTTKPNQQNYTKNIKIDNLL